MILNVNDATGRMIEAFKRNDGKEALANVALMWADYYDLKSQVDTDEGDEESEKGQYCATGLYLITRLIQHLNE